nr:hypothetical protein [Tanacetum cinerariifolium]
MKEPVPSDLPIVNPYVPPTSFPWHSKEHKDDPYKTRETIFMIVIPKKTREAQGEIMIRGTWTKVGILQSRTPFLNDAKVVWEEEHDYIPLQDYDAMGGVMQPLTPQIVHITSLDDDYVASATNHILDMHLKEFGVELFDITGVDEKAYETLTILHSSTRATEWFKRLVAYARPDHSPMDDSLYDFVDSKNLLDKVPAQSVDHFHTTRTYTIDKVSGGVGKREAIKNLSPLGS